MRKKMWLVLSLLAGLVGCSGASPLAPTTANVIEAIPASALASVVPTAQPAAEDGPPGPDRLWFSFSGGARVNPRSSPQPGPLSLTVLWRPVTGAIGYQFEIGSALGASDLAAVDLTAEQTRYTAELRDGRFWARVRARGAQGLGSPSKEIILVVENGKPRLSVR